jgi:hypothetical protein
MSHKISGLKIYLRFVLGTDELLVVFVEVLDLSRIFERGEVVCVPFDLLEIEEAESIGEDDAVV